MFARNLLLALAALVPLVIPSLQDSAIGFELFPRPKGQYTVQRGDTLYGIANYYYTNPALWPFLWNQNPSVVVKDRGGAPEHQPLTPGSIMNLYHSRRNTAVMIEPYRPPTGVPDDIRFLITEIPYQGIPYDKKLFRYKLSMRPTRLWGYIVSCPDVTKTHYLERDLVYIRFRPSKKQAILVGDRFGIYRDRGPVFHPLNPGREIGHVSEVVGEVEITSTGHELATGIILDGYEEIVIGDKICLFTPRQREIVPTKTHRMLEGTILRSASRNTNFPSTNNLENDVVFIDRGECHGMKEGILFNIYRTTHPVEDPYFHRRVSVPDRYVGEGIILKAFEKSSTLLITTSLEEIQPGDVIKSVSD
jgi:hypothetical protein